MPDLSKPAPPGTHIRLTVPVDCAITTAGDWHIVQYHTGLAAFHRSTGEQMPVEQLQSLMTPASDAQMRRAERNEQLKGIDPSLHEEIERAWLREDAAAGRSYLQPVPEEQRAPILLDKAGRPFTGVTPQIAKPGPALMRLVSNNGVTRDEE